MSVVETNTFFKQKRTAAEIKSEIVKAYFSKWCAQILTQLAPSPETILYVDLLAGNLVNEDNSLAEAGLILEQIYRSQETEQNLNTIVKTFFYNASKAELEKLATDLAQLPFRENLENAPVILNEPDQRTYLVELLKERVPALFITNPFFTLLAQELLAPAVQSGNTDLLLVFSPNKMRGAWDSSQERNDLIVLLGEEITSLKEYAPKENSSRKKEQLVVDTLISKLQENQYYPLFFKINLPGKDQTSHYLLFAARTKQAYFLMKEIIARYSDYQEDGVPLFSVNQKPQMPLLPGFFQYLSKYTFTNLLEALSSNRREFHYRTIQEIYEDHAVGTHFILTNYLQAFSELRQQGRINLVDAKNKQVKTISENAIVFYKLHGVK
ncbi:three-Cys-motif partner protein TcmP [Adhaeribacter arboris]|nr:three-Cys-motif partner protein TcmP [Adhaeribacter arboris]